MRKNFNSVQMLETSDVCNKYSKSVSYETLVGGTTTIGRGIKQTRRLSEGCADKPLSAVGTLTSLLCNSAKVVEKLLHRHSERSEGSMKNDIKDWILRLRLRMTMKRRLRMTIPALAFIFTLATTSESSAETWDCGEIANTVSCSLDENGVFTISGTGKMKDYTKRYDDNSNSWDDNRPWDSANIQTVVVGKGVTSIGDSAFMHAPGLTSITIPDSVESIGDSAFRGATGLTSITIPDSVKSIGVFAFRDANHLKSITIPDSVTSIGNYAFWGARSLESITIPEGVTSIRRGTFELARSLESITIPDSVTSIEMYAFYNASSLTSITIPDSVTSIGEAAFNGASSLESITIPDNIDTKNWAASAFSGLPAGIKNIVCQGDLNTCYKKLAKYFSYGDCPQNLIDAGKGNLCSCSDSDYCISPSLISEATQKQCGGEYTWDENSTPKCRHMTDNECANSAQYYINNNGQCKSMPGSKTTCKNADFLWSESSCVKSCASGFVEWDKQCWSEYPFAKKRWTPAEANEWLHDGNDNFVVITFKK